MSRPPGRGGSRSRSNRRPSGKRVRGGKSSSKSGCAMAIPSLPAAAALALTVSWQVWDLGAQS